MGSHEMTAAQVLFALIDAGTIPAQGALYEKAEMLIEEYEDNCNDGVRFSEFLGFVNKLREEGRRIILGIIQSFKQRLNYKPIKVEEVPSLVEYTGLVLDCRCSLEELVSLCSLHEVPDMAEGEEKVADLCFQIVQHARVVSRSKEAGLGSEVGFKVEEVQQLRLTYSQLTRNGALEVSKLHEFLSKIDCRFTEQFVENMIREVGTVTAPPAAGTHEIDRSFLESYTAKKRQTLIGRQSSASRKKTAQDITAATSKAMVMRVPMPISRIQVERSERFQTKTSEKTEKTESIKFDVFLRLCAFMIKQL